MNRKPKLELPNDCPLISVELCEHPKLTGKCKIKYNALGGKSSCMPNEDYLVDQEISKTGFDNFARIDEENLEEELSLRNKLCSQLSKEYCKTNRAKILGCEVSKSIFKSRRCQLSQRIVDFYYKRKRDCILPDCNEVRERYKSMCIEHQTEFQEVLEMLVQAYEDLINHHEDEENSLIQFEENYIYLKDYYGVYLLEKPGTLNKIEEMAMKVRNVKGYGKCQCYNIGDCVGKGEPGFQCQNKMIKTELGYICKTHSKCIKTRAAVYKELRDNFETLCKKRSCKETLAKLKELYNMIKFTTEGEISIFKNELYEMTAIIEYYISELS